MDRDLGLELARINRNGSIASAKWMGHGDKNAADQAAVTGMRNMFDTVNIDGVVVIGEGEKGKRRCCISVKRSVSAVPMRQRLISR